MRRLLALSCSIVLVDTIFFAALSPLLPRFAEELDLSKAESGLLVATYALGGVLGAIPSGLVATRLGVKATVALGLALVAVTSVLFGIVTDYWLLDLTRLAQGIASAFCWTGALAWLVDATPQERRGETIGIAMSAAIVGALLGPVLGAAAVHFGRLEAFSGVAALATVLAVLALRTPSPPPEERQPLRLMLVALRERTVLAGMWLLMLPAVLFGTLSVLAPLQLDALGWGAVGIAATFAVSALVEACLSPVVGRWSDRRGRLSPDPVRPGRESRRLPDDPLGRSADRAVHRRGLRRNLVRHVLDAVDGVALGRMGGRRGRARARVRPHELRLGARERHRLGRRRRAGRGRRRSRRLLRAGGALRAHPGGVLALRREPLWAPARAAPRG